VVQGMENMIRRIVREDISLEFSLDPAIGSVRADQSQFEQVIMNLVVNAREAIASGGRLTMETFNSDVEDPDFARLSGIKLGRYVVLAVTDTGVGMNEATKAHMFEPFFTTKKFLKGTGLGLATVHGIVAQSGGGIAIETAPGQGSKFSIYLPRIAERVAERVAEPVAERVADNSPHAKASHFSETLPGRETILLVEDEDRVLLVLAGMLRSYGYRVLPAHGGQEALEICRSQSEPIHLLLTDAVLPQMGGVEIAKAVQALLPNLPVLYLSGYVDDAVLLSHLGRTGSDVLEKPVTATVLAAKVRQTLDSYAKAHPRSMMRANDHTRTGAGDSA
jgi:two-component system cell cycle sensor histidine kinase/response regulator CckA